MRAETKTCAAVYRESPASASEYDSDDSHDSDCSPELASPDSNSIRRKKKISDLVGLLKSRPSESSRALKSFASVSSREKDFDRKHAKYDDHCSLDSNDDNDRNSALGRLKTRRLQSGKSSTLKALSQTKITAKNEDASEFELRSVCAASSSPPPTVHEAISNSNKNDNSRRKGNDLEKKTSEALRKLVPDDKLEALLIVCREPMSADGENWRDKIIALEQLSDPSYAFSVSKSPHLFCLAVEDCGKHAHDLRATLVKAALKFIRALCENCGEVIIDNKTKRKNDSNKSSNGNAGMGIGFNSALANLGKILLKRASDGSEFLKSDAMDALRDLRSRIGPNAFIKIILSHPSNVNPRLRRTMAQCLSEVDYVKTRIEKQHVERLCWLKKNLEQDGDVKTRAYARKIAIAV